MGGKRYKKKKKKHHQSVIVPETEVEYREAVEAVKPEPFISPKEWTLLAFASVSEYLGWRYGMSVLAYAAALFFWIAITDWTKNRGFFIGRTNHHLGFKVVVALILFGGTWFLTKGGSQAEAKRTDQPTAAADDPEALHIRFRHAQIDMSRKTDVSTFWALYQSSYGATVSPIALLVFAQVTNSFSHPVSISNYSVSFLSDRCDWIRLRPVDTRMVQLLFTDWSLSIAARMDRAELVDGSNSFNKVWDAPIQAYESQTGMLLFDTPTVCAVDWGDHVRFSMDLTTSIGKTYSSTSEEFIVARDFSPEPGGDKQNLVTYKMADYLVDASKAYRRIHGDAMRTIKPAEVGEGKVSSTYTGRSNTLSVPDGVYMSIAQRHADVAKRFR